MKENIPLLNFIKSNKFMLYVAMFTVLALAPNTFFVFHSMSVFKPIYREVASAMVAIIVASSIMIYTLRKNLQVAMYFSLFEILIGGYYYATTIGFDWALIPAAAFTLIQPVSVYFYAKEIDVDIDYNNPDLQRWLEQNPSKRAQDYFLKK